MKRIFNLLKNEYFILSIIILFAFLARLYKLDNPVADWHSWRQADTASVTKTYIDEGIDLLYPRYHDISSIQTGIFNPKGLRFVEFPIFNAIHAVLYRTFPELSFEIWGRLVSIFSSLISVFLIYLIGKRFMGLAGGLLAAFFFAFIPFNIYFSRVILPEPMAVTFALTSIAIFIKFIDSNKFLYLYLSSMLFAVSMLVKPFTFFYTLPIFYLLFKKYSVKTVMKNFRLKLKLLIALDIALIPFFVWRVWINKFPEGIPFWQWAFNGDKIRFRPAFWRWIFGERLGKLILGIWGLIPFSFGLLNTKKYVFQNYFLIGMFLYVTVFATASVRHDYYQIFTIPAISLTLAAGSVTMWTEKYFNRFVSRILLIFSLILMFGVGLYQTREFYKVNHPEIIEAGKALDKIASKDALVIAPYNGDTAFLYQTKRWGWPAVDDSIENIIKRGADYYVSVSLDHPDTKYVMENYKILERTSIYVIADLNQKSE